MDKILESWHRGELMSIEQIEAAEQSKNNTATAAAKPSFSVDKFDSYLQNRTLKYKKEEE